MVLVETTGKKLLVFYYSSVETANKLKMENGGNKI